jgi:hypothetical protein
LDQVEEEIKRLCEDEAKDQAAMVRRPATENAERREVTLNRPTHPSPSPSARDPFSSRSRRTFRRHPRKKETVPRVVFSRFASPTRSCSRRRRYRRRRD